MSEESVTQEKEQLRLSTEQQAEIGDILLSARAVSRQMVNQAREQSDEILQTARDRAEQIMNEASEKAARALREADEKAAAIVGDAREEAANALQEAEDQAAAIIQEAEEKGALAIREADDKASAIISDAVKRTAASRKAEETADSIIVEAESRAAAILREAEKKAAESEEPPAESDGTPGLEAMQDYVVQYVGDCFARLRQQQLDSVALINEQWQSFLSGLQLVGEGKLPEKAPPAEEVSSQDIERRVSAIAKELMDIIGKQT